MFSTAEIIGLFAFVAVVLLAGVGLQRLDSAITKPAEPVVDGEMPPAAQVSKVDSHPARRSPKASKRHR
jgi:hypothetical protein